MEEIPSPEISKEKRKAQKQKKRALQDFLQKGETAPSFDLASTNLSDQEEKLDEDKDKEEKTSCTVCSIELGERKKDCGFCNEPACAEHLRKKRRNKDTNKFARICDNCEDKFLFNKYMKLELKNEESIAAQESIFQAKYDEIQEQLKGKKTKMLMLQHKEKELQGVQKEQEAKINQQENELKLKSDKFEKRMKEVNDLEAKLDELEKKLPPAYEEDFHSLEIQNDKVNKDLLKYEKMCNEAIKAKSKREKEIYEEYNQWEQTQRQKITKKKEDDCQIF